MATMCFISIVFATWRHCDQRHSAMVMVGVDVVKTVVAPPRARVRVRVVVSIGLGLGVQRPLAEFR